jgi:hypothetical protein
LYRQHLNPLRTLFLLLVGANVALFAWARLAPPDPGLDPRPLGRQIEPAKLRILSEQDLAALQPQQPPQPVRTEPQARACVEWGAFTLAAASRAEQALEPLALGSRLASRRRDETARWWVFIPPKAGKAGAQKAADELRSLGLDDFHVMQEEGKLRWAISLGVFSTEAAANARLEAARAKGVRDAQTGPRETLVTKVSFQVQEADAETRARLAEILQQFPGTELRDCRPG